MDSGKKVYVGNLDATCTTEELDQIFAKYGTLASTWVARNPPGFAFVTFEDARDAQDAVSRLDGNKMNGKHIRVEIARGSKGPRRGPPEWRKDNEGRGRSGGDGGGYGGRRRSPSPFRNDGYNGRQENRSFGGRDKSRSSSPWHRRGGGGRGVGSTGSYRDRDNKFDDNNQNSRDTREHRGKERDRHDDDYDRDAGRSNRSARYS